MNIDELQERFNELRGKKWRVAGRNERVEICGFRVDRSGRGLITVQIETAPYAVYIDADSLSTVAGVGQVPFIEEVSPYADWKIDAPVKYWDGPHERHGHYAGTDDNGNATVWDFGGTSWTTQSRFPAPDFVELAEDLK